MRKFTLMILLLFLFPVSVQAVEILPADPPESALEYMPDSTGDFGQDLWYVIRSAFLAIRPDIQEAFQICVGIFAAALLLSILKIQDGLGKSAAEVAGVVVIACLLFRSTNSMIALGVDTVNQISEYGKLLLPVMAAALAAQGGVGASTALYTGTAILDTVLSWILSSFLVPAVYVYLVFGILNSATGDGLVKQLRDFVKWIMVWCLKIILYVFTGYLSITGVVCGTTDQATLKATKLTISSTVPVVGGILSDASEALLASIHLAKNSAGVFGILALVAILVGPFLMIAAHAVLLRLSAGACAVFGDKWAGELIGCFSFAMTFLLSMTGVACFLQMISLVCFMKGMG